MFTTFSPKQLRLLRWWLPGSADGEHDAVICDGAVRSGKTVCMALSFFLWASITFSGRSFALCGKTIASLRRNLLTPVTPFLKSIGFGMREKLSENWAEISIDGRTNRYYFFGGKDEGSAALIQGMTLGGVLFDEAALMPRSFVEQALARCSLEGSRYWFNCNPENPMHWFRREWLDKTEEKNALHLHLTMEDNPALTPEIRRRYENLYSGAFYERFVLGKWVAAEGLVYPMFDPKLHIRELPDGAVADRRVVSCDYGTVNPASFGLWAHYAGAWYRVREYYFDSRREQYQRTDEEHYAALEELAGNLPIDCVIADPSAASFFAVIRKHGRFRAIKAKNDVTDGIRRVAGMLKSGALLFAPSCKDTLREFSLYRWEENSGKDAPRKENDHAMDDVRYLVSTADEAAGGGDFFAAAVTR
ncbi:MAG: PBSX family phage terminase large subunit [Oscillospiraceae bacterium]|jgi:PBSX family phage terminase large subunit|nr:PBSX family phage terminase large subunit [Oscillospiraceae bacterium]